MDDKQNRPLIFISNDDGVKAKGLRALIDFANEFGDLVVVAPSLPQSGKSSSITVENPLRVTQRPTYKNAKIYEVNGTPVDCTKLAMHAIMSRKPDLVIAGINHGANTGNSAIYSGTMGIVFEGSMLGIPSIGFSYLSHHDDADFSPCESVVKKVISKVMEKGLPKEVCLNVNIPKDCIVKGMQVGSAARGRWTEEFEERVDPHGQPYFWLTGKYKNYEPDNQHTDLYYLSQEYASIVPCKADQTAFDDLLCIENIII